MQTVFKITPCRRWLSLFLTAAFVFALNACAPTEQRDEFSVPETAVIASGIAAQNENYTLYWDSEQCAMLLEDRSSGLIWSSVPYGFYLLNEGNVNLSSPLFIEYYSPEDGSLQTAKAYSDCIEENSFSAEAIDGGVRLTFWFSDAEAAVSVDFILRADSLAVSVPFERIEESGKTKLISVSLLPYFCSVPNSGEQSSYLFVPSGSGAIMYTDEEIQNVSRTFTGEMYGSDAASIRLDDAADETALTVPVYGVTAKENSLMAIIEQGDSYAEINAEAGNFRNGYSTVYSTIILRGSDETEAERSNYADEEIYAEAFDKESVYTVGFYPLSGEGSGYNGMARRYKQYLSDNGMLAQSSARRARYHINFLGGAMTETFFLGFPYDSLTAATTFDQAADILEDLCSSENSVPAVTLTGFGQTGVDAGRIAGGIAFASVLGGEKGYQRFEKYCENRNIEFFLDFDAVYFNSSGSGVRKRFDTAKTPGRQAAAFYPVTVGIRASNESLDKIRLLKRSKLNLAVNQVLDFTESFSSGISIASLSSVAYSDYSSPEYFVKGGISQQVPELFAQIREAGHLAAGCNANGYAAAAADLVYNTPLDCGGYLNLDCSVPFYALVFGENTALYSAALNLAENSDAMLLRAIEAGVSPSFTLISEYDEKLAYSAYSGFYGTCYAGLRDEIASTLQRVADFYRAISGQYAAEHEILSQGVSRTVFSSGTTVYVNYNKTTVTVPDFEIPAMSFMFVE